MPAGIGYGPQVSFGPQVGGIDTGPSQMPGTSQRLMAPRRKRLLPGGKQQSPTTGGPNIGPMTQGPGPATGGFDSMMGPMMFGQGGNTGISGGMGMPFGQMPMFGAAAPGAQMGSNFWNKFNQLGSMGQNARNPRAAGMFGPRPILTGY